MRLNTTKIASLLLAFTMAASLAACSSEAASSSEDSSTSEETASSETTTTTTEDGIASFGPATDFDYLNFTYDQGLTTDGLWDGITALDYVTLPEDFANVTVPTEEVTPTEESIQAQLDLITESYATTESVTDRAAESGDTVNVDYAGSIGGVLFTGGTATGYDLTLGSATFIDGFEEAIIGHEVGETFDITVTFPEGYSDSTDADGNTIVLSGAEATFAITLNSISATVTPELTDDWVYENLYALAGFTTTDDLVEAITEELFLQNIDVYVWNYISENAVITEVPAVIINYQVCQFLSYYDYQAYYYGVDLDTFVTTLIGLDDVDAFLAMQEDTILMYAELSLMQQAVAESLGLEVTDELMEGYAEYLDSNPEAYVALNALANLVDEVLVDGAVMS
ncbi:MAG: FKBP-type peptidyl-prolyl cis-trans isomerase [Faecalibacterium sp.]